MNEPNKENLFSFVNINRINNPIKGAKPRVGKIAMNVPTANPKAIEWGDFLITIIFLKYVFKFIYLVIL